jgi:prepilin-type N-terminal cleavage/methylation domain-containing protein
MLRFVNSKTTAKGFTLAELLIALAILGVIATFTIPKILNATGSGQAKAVAKEVASMISGAAATLQTTTAITSATTARAFTPFMNYVSTSAATAATFQGNNEATTAGTNLVTCAASNVECLVLHNGAIVQYQTNQSFGGSNSTNYISFSVDPDGTGTTNAGATFLLYYNGRLTTRANKGGTDATAASPLTEIAADPTWIATWN